MALLGIDGVFSTADIKKRAELYEKIGVTAADFCRIKSSAARMTDACVRRCDDIKRARCLCPI